MSFDFNVRPQIFISLLDGASQTTILPVLNGLEEEGIPFHFFFVEAANAIDAAYQAAIASSLDVGIGCDQEKLVLHYKNLKPQKPYLTLLRYQTKPVEQLKCFGGNAARLVKGIPFKQIE